MSEQPLAPPPPSTFYTTFYSYKGGVGRTAALINTAWILARSGARVVVIDADLEAPGFPDYHELGDQHHPGFLELATAFSETGVCPEVGPYLVPAPGLPELLVMSAGAMDPDWGARVHRLDWTALHPQAGTALFVEQLRRQLRDAIRADYVLIDARTGFAEVAGVTTHLFADLVVLLFRQARTSIAGTVQVAHSLRAKDRAILPVVSLVPPGQAQTGTLGARRLDQARKLLADVDGEPEIVRIDYDPAAMVAEGLAMASPEQYPQACQGYRELARRLGDANPADLGRALARVAAMRSQGQDGAAYLREHLERHPSARGQAALGDLLWELGRASDALVAYDAALEEPGPAAWWVARGRIRLFLGDTAGAAEDLEMAEQRGKAEVPVLVLRTGLAEADGNVEAARAARRALRTALGDVPGRSRPTRQVFVATLEALPPRPGFDPGQFWDRVLRRQHPELQERWIEALMAGTMTPEEFEAAERALGDHPTKLKILFLSADPLRPLDPSARLQLEREREVIVEQLQASRARDQIEVEAHLSFDIEDFQSLVDRSRASVVHFSGHGDASGALVVGRDRGRPQYLRTEGVVGTIRILNRDGHIQLMALLASGSAGLAQRLAQEARVTCVIGVAGNIDDDAAQIFSKELYRALGDGRSLGLATELAVNQLRAVPTHRRSAELVQVYAAPGVDLFAVSLVD